MRSAANLRRILPSLPRAPCRGPWYRAVAFDNLLGPPPGSPASSPVQPLWPKGAKRKGARFTPAAVTGTTSFGCIYLALDENTPLLEVTGILKPPGSSIPLLFVPQVLMTVDGVLADIVDLTDAKTQSALGTSLQELTGDWVVQQDDYLTGRSPMPPTQVLAQAAYGVGDIVGLRYSSSKSVAAAIGMVVFSDRLVSGTSYLEVFNTSTGTLQQRLP